MKEIKTIGVLTSGGDAPGMNAAVRAVVRTAISKGFKVIGIRHGYNGLITGDVYEMDLRSVSEIIHRGGTILYTARCLEFRPRKASRRLPTAARSTASTRWLSSAATVPSAALVIWLLWAFPASVFPAPSTTISPAVSTPSVTTPR